MSAAETPVSRVYAQALIELGDEHGNLPRIADEFAAFHDAWKRDAAVRRFLSSPAISRERKQDLVLRLGDRFSDDFQRFLGVLAQKARIGQAGSIFASFQRILEERGGLVRARATFATPMEERVVSQIEEELAERLDKKVSLWVETDPEILGGMVLRVGDRRVDLSLRNQLEQFRSEVLAG